MEERNGARIEKAELRAQLVYERASWHAWSLSEKLQVNCNVLTVSFVELAMRSGTFRPGATAPCCLPHASSDNAQNNANRILQPYYLPQHALGNTYGGEPLNTFCLPAKNFLTG